MIKEADWKLANIRQMQDLSLLGKNFVSTAMPYYSPFGSAFPIGFSKPLGKNVKCLVQDFEVSFAQYQHLEC